MLLYWVAPDHNPICTVSVTAVGVSVTSEVIEALASMFWRTHVRLIVALTVPVTVGRVQVGVAEVAESNVPCETVQAYETFPVAFPESVADKFAVVPSRPEATAFIETPKLAT